MRNLVIAGALAAVAVAAPASAQTAPTPTIIFNQGVFAPPAFSQGATTVQSFDNTVGNNTPYIPRLNEIVTGDVRSQSGNVPGVAVDPNPALNNYIGIVNGSYRLNLGAPVQVFSFVLGSLDTYNTVQLFFANGTSRTYNGAAIIGQPVTFNQNGNSSVAGRVTYDLGGQSGVTSALFSSTQASLEIDEIVTAVPEPATWGLMILGFGVVGAQLRTRRRTAGTLAKA